MKFEIERAMLGHAYMRRAAQNTSNSRARAKVVLNCARAGRGMSVEFVNSMMVVMVMLVGLFGPCIGCLPYEYEDPDVLRRATARFGAAYTLHAEPPPWLAADAVALQ